MKKRSILLLLMALVLILPLTVASAASYHYVSGTSSLKLREKPDASATVIGSYRKDYAVVSYKKYDSNWAYISFSDGTSGYVKSKYLKAGSTYTAYVKKDDTSLRSGPADSFSETATLLQGAKVKVYTSGAAWCYVSSDKGTGYVRKSRLSTSKVAKSQSSSSAGSTRYVVSPDGKKVNLRHGPNEKTYAVKVRMDPGSAVTVISSENGWSKVQYGVWTGYVKNEYLSSANPSESASATTATTESTFNSFAASVVNPRNRKVNMRSGAGKGYSTIAQLKPGTAVTVTGESGTWYQISYNGNTGYMMKQYLSAMAPSGASTATTETESTFDSFTATVVNPKNRTVNMRSGASKDYPILMELDPGTSVTVTGESGTWYKISYNGSTGYMMKEYLSTGTTTTTTTETTFTSFTGYVVNPKNRTVNMRSGASKDYPILVELDPGTPVTVSGESGSWYKISYNGNTGYMMKEYISTTKPSTSTTTATTETTFTSFTGTVVNPKNRTVNMRSGAGKSYPILMELNPGTSVSVIGESGNWYKISYNGSTGYMMKEYIKK